MRKTLIAIILLCFVSACVEKQQPESKDIEKRATEPIDKQLEKKQNTSIKNTDNESLKANAGSNKTKDECLNVNVGDKSILKNQTFNFDFEPFKNSCFVTAYDPEYNDPPTAIELALYKDGEKIYTFDSRFNPESVNCSVNAVSFKDLNKDSLEDIIVIGKCEVKSGDMHVNEVFMNTGKKTFKTDTYANDKLDNLKTVEEITNFVKKNEDIFFN